MTTLASFDEEISSISDQNQNSCHGSQGDSNEGLRRRKPNLHRRHEIPLHLRFNRYVLDHYRPPSNFAGCLYSLFYFHNETVNIFTHAIPMLAIFMSNEVLLPWDEITIPILPALHMIAFVSPWIGSTIYHLFMNHEHGYHMYKKLLLTDMLGIWIAQNLGSLTTVVSTCYCFDEMMRSTILTGFAMASLFSLYKAFTAKCPWQRRYSFIMPFVFRIGVLMLRLSGGGGGHPDAVWHLIIQDIVAISGAYIGATNIPEKWFPGNLDLVFNSHHIMHVMVVYAAYQMHLAVRLDLLWMTGVDKGQITC